MCGVSITAPSPCMMWPYWCYSSCWTVVLHVSIYSPQREQRKSVPALLHFTLVRFMVLWDKGQLVSHRSTIFWGDTLTQQQHPRKFGCLTSDHNNETLRQRGWPFIVINPQVTRTTVGHFCQLTIFVLLSWFTPSVPRAHLRWHSWWWKVINICTVVSGAPWGYQRRVSLAFSDASLATHSHSSR